MKWASLVLGVEYDPDDVQSSVHLPIEYEMIVAAHLPNLLA